MSGKNIFVAIIMLVFSSFWVANSYARVKSHGIKDTIPPLHSLTESDIHYSSNGQYISIDVHDLPPSVASYYLNYYSVEIHKTVKYPLCSNILGDTKCTGKIALSSLLISNSGDLLSISDSRGRVTPRQSADILINKINQGLTQVPGYTPWTSFKCGLKSPTELPPAPECNLSARGDTKVADACKPSAGSPITKSVVGFYYPDKFTKGKFGLSCTGVPIGENWVITAAHCVYVGKDFYVKSNREFLLTGTTKLPMEIAGTKVSDVPNAIVIESQYVLKVLAESSPCNNTCAYADFALLKVKNHKFSTIIPLASSVPLPHTKVWRAGYGKHTDDGLTGIVFDGHLNYRNEYFYDSTIYGVIQSVGSWPEEKDNYRAWKFTGGGDSGGPLFIYKNNQFSLLSTLTGAAYLSVAGIICGAVPNTKLPGTLVIDTSIPYWKSTIESIMNGTIESSAIIVN